MLLFTQCKATWSTAISSSCLAAFKMSAFKSHVQQNACYRNMKWPFEDLLTCYCCVINPNSRTIRSQLLQPVSAGKGWDMNELQPHHCMTHNCEPGSCAVWMSYQHVPLQELSQLIEVELLTSGFLKIFGSSSQFPGECPLPPCGRPCLHLTRNSFYILFPAKGIMSCRQVISSRLYIRLKGTCSLAIRELLNTKV